MAIEFDHRIDKELLRVKATGHDENLEQVQEYGLAVMRAALENNCTKIICDESDLEYSLGTFDIFELVKSLSEVVPKVVKVALIYKPTQFDDVKFWENVAVNRGVQVRIFKDQASAEKWIE